MRRYSVAILHRVGQLIGSFTLGYAFGRAHQSFMDAGQIANYKEALKYGAATVRHTIRKRYEEHHGTPK